MFPQVNLNEIVPVDKQRGVFLSGVKSGHHSSKDILLELLFQCGSTLLGEVT